MDTQQVEHFPATSGRITGWIGVAAAAAVVGSALWFETPADALPWVVGGTLAGLLVYAAVLRPRVSLATPQDGEDALVLRGMVDTVHLPLPAIEELAVRQVLAVRVGERRYVSSAVGRPWRKVVRTPATGETTRREIVEGMSTADYTEERIRVALDDARRESGVAPWSEEQAAAAAGVRRERAWWLLGGLVGLTVLLVLVLAL